MAYRRRFIQALNSRYALLQESIVFAVAQMVRNCVPFEGHYFSKKKRHGLGMCPEFWRRKNPKSFGEIIQKEHQRPERTIADDTLPQAASLATQGAWGLHFYEMPHSDDGLASNASFGKTSVVSEWFLGQK